MSQKSLDVGVKTKPAYWLSHFEKWASSGLSQEKYCKQHKISFAKFGYWRTKLLASDKSKSPSKELFKSICFSSKQEVHSSKDVSISILLQNGVRIMLNVNQAELNPLFQQLSSLTC
jgi:hypothetical protein